MSVYAAGYRGLGTSIMMLPLFAIVPKPTATQLALYSSEAARLRSIASVRDNAALIAELDTLRRAIGLWQGGGSADETGPNISVRLRRAAEALGVESKIGTQLTQTTLTPSQMTSIATPIAPSVLMTTPPTASLPAPGMLGIPRWAIIGGGVVLAGGLVWMLFRGRRA